MELKSSRLIGAGWALVWGAVLSGVADGAEIIISPPTVDSNRLAFSFYTETNKLFTVQSASSLSSGWTDLSYHVGAGVDIGFVSALTLGQTFFRVRCTPLQVLSLTPTTPLLPSGSVSLPDATVGVAYSATVSLGLSGVPPYSLLITGSPPDGLSLTVVSNGTGYAELAIASSGSGLIAGQRTQFNISVTDGLNQKDSRDFDLRTVAPPPQLSAQSLVFKAGQTSAVQLAVSGGTVPLTCSLVSGKLPDGLTLSTNGMLAGTPTADSPEENETGLYTNMVEIADSYTDRITGTLVPRKVTQTVQVRVRLSYLLNIRATRPNGPSLEETCLFCHGPGFPPDCSAGSAQSLLNTHSGSGGFCGTARVYILPGNTAGSLIYQKLSLNFPCGDRMPQGGPYFTDLRLERLGRWIRELTSQDTD